MRLCNRLHFNAKQNNGCVSSGKLVIKLTTSDESDSTRTHMKPRYMIAKSPSLIVV